MEPFFIIFFYSQRHNLTLVIYEPLDIPIVDAAIPKQVNETDIVSDPPPPYVV